MPRIDRAPATTVATIFADKSEVARCHNREVAPHPHVVFRPKCVRTVALGSCVTEGWTAWVCVCAGACCHTFQHASRLRCLEARRRPRGTAQGRLTIQVTTRPRQVQPAVGFDLTICLGACHTCSVPTSVSYRLRVYCCCLRFQIRSDRKYELEASAYDYRSAVTGVPPVISLLCAPFAPLLTRCSTRLRRSH